MAALVILLVLIFIWWGWQSFGPRPKLVISRETTYLTEPLAEDGLPHYGQALQSARREGVTSDNNAAVPFWQAMWPGGITEDDRRLFAEELGIEPERLDAARNLEDSWESEIAELLKWQGAETAVAEKPYSDDFDSNCEDELGHSDDDEVEQSLLELERNPWKRWADRVVTNSRESPWSTESFPPLADWLERNHRQLELLVEAAERPKWYSPSIAILRGERWAVVEDLCASLDQITACRGAARALSRRAMASLGDGSLQAAWRDIRAVHRLAGHLSTEEVFLNQLVAMAVSGMAVERTHQLLAHESLTPELARSVHKDLMALDSMFDIRRATEVGERLYQLEYILRAAECTDRYQNFMKERETIYEDLGIEERFIPRLLLRLTCDLNHVLPSINELTDSMVAAARETSAIRRQAAMQLVDAKLEGFCRQPTKSRILLSFFSRSVRNRVLAEQFIRLMEPSFGAMFDAQDRINTKISMVRLATALAIYRTENGEYPEALEALVPSIFDELPVDFYQELPFVYQRKDNGFLLYSLGANGEDDRGSNGQMEVYNGYPIDQETADSVTQLLSEEDLDLADKKLIPEDADDVAIRFPLPVPAFPEPPHALPAE